MNTIFILVIFIVEIIRNRYQTSQSKYPLINTCNSEGSSVKLVQVIFRHAERNPLSGLGLDLKSEGDWPGGFEQLTDTGKRQSLELGRYIRKRYKGFLRESYNYKEIYVRSTDVDRTLVTAQGVLAGLFPYTENDLSNFGIPVHTTQLNNDMILIIKSCPHVMKSFVSGIKTTKTQDILDKHKDVADFILKMIGNTDLAMSAFTLLDNLHVQNSLIHKLPNSLDKKTYDKLMKLYLEMYNTLGIYNNSDLRIGGPFLKELISHMTMKKDDVMGFKDKKIFIYSVHDIHISGILNLLGTYILDQRPGHVATVLLELHAKTSDNYYVQLFYRNTTQSDPYKLSIPGCPAMCPLDHFVKIISTEKFKDLDKLCNLD